MNCRQCLKKAECNTKQLGPLCRNCFSEIIEKRVRKYLRLNDNIHKNDKIAVFGNLSYFFIKKIIKDLPLTTIKIKNNNEIKKFEKKYKIIVDETLDDEINEFLLQMFTNKRRKKEKYIRPLRFITDEEAAVFASFYNINFKPIKKNPHISEFLENIEKEHPEIKYSLSKTVLNLEKYL